MPKYSVIIPCHNSFKLMDKCLKNLEKQTFKDFEVVIIDDCSTDDSYEKIIEYSKQSKLNMIIHRIESNVGPGQTRNIGIEKSSGDYIFMLDADDYIEIYAIEQINYIIDTKNVDCVFYDFYEDNGVNLYERDTVDTLPEGDISKSDALVYSSGSVVGKVFKSEIIKNNNVKFLDLKRNEDMPFNKVAISYCNSFYYIKANLYHYIMHNSSIMHDTKTLDEKNEIIAFEHIKEIIENRFPVETEAIFVKEYLYGITMTLLAKKCKSKYIKECIKNAKKLYPNWYKNPMILNYPKHVKICLKLIKAENIILLKGVFLAKLIIIKILGK